VSVQFSQSVVQSVVDRRQEARRGIEMTPSMTPTKDDEVGAPSKVDTATKTTESPRRRWYGPESPSPVTGPDER
jgi:hypothetical protein